MYQNETLVPVKKQLPFFVGVGKHFLMKSENVYPPLMNSVISRWEVILLQPLSQQSTDELISP